MVDPTAFAKVGLADTTPSGTMSILKAGALGQSQRLEQEESTRRQRLQDIAIQDRTRGQEQSKLAQMIHQDVADAWRSKDQNAYTEQLSRLAEVSPELAGTVKKTFDGLRFDNASGAAFSLLGAMSSPKPEAQDRLLKDAYDKLGVGPEHPIARDIADLIEMEPGDKRNMAIAEAVNVAEKMKLFGEKKTAPSAKQKTGAWLVRDKNTGQMSIVTGSYDTQTGELETTSGALPENFEVLSKEGETPTEATERRVGESTEKEKEKQAVAMGTKYAESADKLNEQINTLEQGIGAAEKAIEAGESLGIGWIESKLPKLSRTKVEFENIGRRLGLGIIQSATFGALSEAEMKLAMETGMPTNISKDEDMLQWLKERQASVTKLRNYYDEAAEFLSEGNTVSEWKKLQRQKYKTDPNELKDVPTEELMKGF